MTGADKYIASATATLVAQGAWRVTKYISPKQVLRVTRRRYLRGRSNFARALELVVNYGPPNYDERRFIDKCKRAGEPFPIRKMQIKSPPKGR